MTRPAILARLRGVKPAGKGWNAFCPAHDDHHKQSLSVGVGDDGRTLLKCHARGCPPEMIVGAVDMNLADLGPRVATGARQARREIATYDYTDERGELLYQVVRFDPKDFRLRRPDGAGGWTWSLADVRRVVYHLQDLAEQPTVYLVEGEKDADRLHALGLVATTSPSGSNSWRDEYAKQIAAAGIQEVVAIPDNDEPGRTYVRQAGQALRAAGLTVRELVLPGLPEKGDVSDWLDAGHTVEELEQLVAATSAVTFATAAVELEPMLRREGCDLLLTWPDGVQFELAAIRDGREGIRGELTVTRAGRRLSWTSFSLPSAPARETLRKKLGSIAPDVPWGDYLEEAAWRFTQAARQGEPLVELTGQSNSTTRELVPGLLYESESTEVIGDGETGKSLVAQAVAAAVHGNAALPFGLKPVRAVPVAYLDWETSRDTLEHRIALLAAGLGIDPPAILYKRMTRPLVDEVSTLAPEFARRGVGLVITDSMMFAVASGEGAAFHEPITAFFNALRLFAPAASLVLNHITNEDARSGRAARPFGGAFAFNGPRLIWEAKRDREVTDASAIAFTCIKANNLPRRPDPFGLRFVPGNGTITIYPFDLKDAAPQSLAGASLTYRVRLAIASGVKKAKEIAEHLNAKPDSVERLLRRLRKDGKAREIDGTWELVS